MKKPHRNYTFFNLSFSSFRRDLRATLEDVKDNSQGPSSSCGRERVNLICKLKQKQLRTFFRFAFFPFFLDRTQSHRATTGESARGATGRERKHAENVSGWLTSSGGVQGFAAAT